MQSDWKLKPISKHSAAYWTTLGGLFCRLPAQGWIQRDIVPKTSGHLLRVFQFQQMASLFICTATLAQFKIKCKTFLQFRP